MKYPNGNKSSFRLNPNKNDRKPDFSNRGMTLEEDINTTNQYYLSANKAVIHKKPTPVQIVRVDYPKRSAAVIKEGYFKQASTTDYNGLYRGKYVDFEAKETRNKTSFPLANIHDHQIEHMKSVIKHGGICFLIIRFTAHQETYLLLAERIFSYWEEKQRGGRKSIPFDYIREVGFTIPFHYQARIDYVPILDKLYF